MTLEKKVEENKQQIDKIRKESPQKESEKIVKLKEDQKIQEENHT